MSRAAAARAAAILAALQAAVTCAGCREAPPDTGDDVSTAPADAPATAAAGAPETAAAPTGPRSYYAPPSFAALADAAAPSVLSIVSGTTVREPSRAYGVPEEYEGRALGSGFVIDGEGHVLTAAGVIEGATIVLVSFSDGREERATIVGRDRATDLALLKIEPRADVRPLKLGDSDAVEVGDWVVAVGNPYGLSHTVTAGVISATLRTRRDFVGAGRDPSAALGLPDRTDFFQTDASINEGNAGGPLLDLAGEVIGVASDVEGPGRGIHFAVPSNLAARVARALAAHGRVERSFIGVYSEPLTPAVAEKLGLDRAAGALVVRIEPGSPAEKAGLREGDVVLELGGKAVGSPAGLARLVEVVKPGTETALRIWRGGTATKVAVKPAVLPEDLR
jgi:serine protease Do